MTQPAAMENQGDARAQEAPALGKVGGILRRHDGERGGLIAILAEIQDENGYLPEEALRMVSENTGHSLVDIYGVATFYRSLSLQPRGKHLITVCLGTACHVRGASRVVEEFERHLAVEVSDTTPDMEFTLETVNCLGACALGPIAVIDGVYFSNVSALEVKHILGKVRNGLQEAQATASSLR